MIITIATEDMSDNVNDHSLKLTVQFLFYIYVLSEGGAEIVPNT